MSWCAENLRDCQAWKDLNLPMSSVSNDAVRYFDATLRQYVSWIDCNELGGIEESVKKMKEYDPDFVMGKVLDCGLELMGTGRTMRLDKEFKEQIEDLAQQAAGKSSLNPWEQSHCRAINEFANGRMIEATNVWEGILEEHPLDLLALKFAHDAYFYLGEQRNMRDSVLRVQEKEGGWKEGMPLYGHLYGMLSFGYVENDQYDLAEKAGLQALGINRQDAWATHALAHVYEMQGRCQKGIKFMTSTLKDWNACGMLACHNHWHWALYHIENGDFDVAEGMFDREIGKRVESGALLDIVDATSLLFRLQLEGIEIGKEKWEKVHEICAPHLNDHILLFNDAHLIMSSLGIGNVQLAREQKESLMDFAKFVLKYGADSGSGTTNAARSSAYGESILGGLIAFETKDYGTAADALYPIRNEIVKIGGSNAQRDVFNLLLIHSCLRSSQSEHHKWARELLLERESKKPGSQLTARMMCQLRKLSLD